MTHPVDDFLQNFAKPKPSGDEWGRVIQPESSYLVLGDIRMGKSGLAYWLLERFSQEYGLRPATVLPGESDKVKALLPDNFEVLSDIHEVKELENAIVFVDEADLQLPLSNTKLRDTVVNFLALAGQRHQIFLLAYHYPRLVLSTYLAGFHGFLHKRPPYLLEFATKGGSKEIRGMMERAEERFTELPKAEDAVKFTYVVAPRLRWQGMLENPLPSFWSDNLSRVWTGAASEAPPLSRKLKRELEEKAYLREKREGAQVNHEGGVCCICQNPSPILLSGVCERCFDLWALKARQSPQVGKWLNNEGGGLNGTATVS